MKTIGIISQKGGVGKTTTAVNLSYELASGGLKVCLIDFDPQANATTHCGVCLFKQNSIYHFLRMPESENNVSFDEIKQDTHGFSVIPSSRKLTVLASDHPGGNKILKNSIIQHKELQEYDYVIIDGPPQPGFLNNNAICASDYVVIVAECKFFGADASRKVMDTMRAIKENVAGVSPKFLGVLPTFYNISERESTSIHQSLNKHFSDKLFMPIRKNTAISRASGEGVPVAVYDKNCPGAHDYGVFGRSVLSFIEGDK